jgi:nitrate reductase NapAB chaperone NapD
MIFSNFFIKTNKYLKSVRILKNYVSIDMVFPTTWKMLNNKPNEIEILQNETNEGTMITSFICVNEKEYIDLLETSLDAFVKTNIEREEKEKLFKSKVQELKSIFDKEKLENLKSLKFDIEELTKYLENEEPKNVERVAETTENV